MTRRCSAPSWALLVLIFGVAIATPLAAQDFALRVGKVITAAGEGPFEIEDATVLVQDGKIVAVGRDVSIPASTPTIDRPDAVLVPGFVAADTNFLGQHRGDESVAADYRAIDAYDPYGDFRPWLMSGVTTVHIDPGAHRLLTGQGAIVALGGAPDARVLNPQSDLTVNLGVYNPPSDLDFSFPASSDVAIEVPTLQRPSSRLGQFLGLTEALDAARVGGEFSNHGRAFVEAWNENRPLRIEADRAADLLGAATFLEQKNRRGYLVGGAEAHVVADTLARTGLPLVYRPRQRFSSATSNIGASDAAIKTDYRDLLALDGKVALAPPANESLTQLRLAAVAAHGAGLSRERAIAAITRTPAEILGVSDHVGSIAPGRRADFVLFTADPLEVTAQPMAVYVGGQLEYDAPMSSTVIVRAGTIWVSPERQVENGEMLIEDGKVVSIGRSVRRPRGARVIDAGADGFVAPGMIDARGHLGLQGDRQSVTPDVDLTLGLGVPDVTEDRVLDAGVTTVMLTPYAITGRGARISAVKTAGDGRADRVIESIAAVTMSVRGQDPSGIGSGMRRTIDRAKKYTAAWAKYEKEIKEWEEKKAKGEAKEEKKVVEEEVVEEGDGPDPITGVWEGTITGGPLPEPQTGKLSLQLTGDQIEGRVIEPAVPVEHRIVMTLNDKEMTGIIEVETDGMGYPQIAATLVEDDRMEGSISLMGISVEFSAERVDKKAVSFKVEKRTRIKSNRPEPPKVDASLEPFRALLERKIPLSVEASTPAEIREVVKTIVDGYKFPLVLIGAEGAEPLADMLREKKVSIVLPQSVLRTRQQQPYSPASALSGHGLTVAFQSGAEDGARDLPLAALFAVEQGMGADEALAALTTHPAKMFGIDDRVGSLEPGRDADFVIYHGHPFRRGARVERVFVGGEEANR
ncbi:MAG: amidohydrolase family protein [Planctomycetota bacterium]